MNSWNSKQVHSSYPCQSLGFLTRVSPTSVNVNPPSLAHTIRDLVGTENLDPNDPATLKRGKDIVAKLPPKPQSPFQQPTFGYVCQWVSEIGDTETLQGLLNHADQFMNPKWENGGLYYPRHDSRQDRDGNWLFVDPHTGNAAIAYARLNFPGGQKGMWEKPWTKEEVQRRPWLDGVSFENGVDVLRASWVEEEEAMVLTMRTWDDKVRRLAKFLRPTCLLLC
jgi:Linalool dehydratase/isomerase